MSRPLTPALKPEQDVVVPENGDPILADTLIGMVVGAINPSIQALLDKIFSVFQGQVFLRALHVGNPTQAGKLPGAPPPDGQVDARTLNLFWGSSVVGVAPTAPVAEGLFVVDDVPFVRVTILGAATPRARNVKNFTRTAAGNYTFETHGCPAVYAGLADGTQVYPMVAACMHAPAAAPDTEFASPRVKVTKEAGPVLRVVVRTGKRDGTAFGAGEEGGVSVNLWP